MKHFYTLAFILAVSFSCRAQTQKGDQLLGGSLSLSTGKGTTTQYNGGNTFTGSDKLSSYGIGPLYSYFIADKLDLGAAVGYSNRKVTSTFGTTVDKDNQRGINYAVYLRKYFLYDNKVGFRVGPFVSYQNTKSTTDYGNPVSTEETTEKDLNAGIGFDFVYFPSRHLGLAAGLGSLAYSRLHYTETIDGQLNQEQKDHTFGLNLATSGLTLSVFYAFGK